MNTNPMQPSRLKVPIHPGILLGLGILLAALLRFSCPCPLGLHLRWVLVILSITMLAAIALGAWAFATFKKQGTNPDCGAEVQALLTNGPYRYSRNPLFITNALIFASIAFMLDNVWAICLLPLLVFCLDRLVIAREEPFLLERFGRDYAEYCLRVRRWI